MIAGLKPYRAYKDSGVPWLGYVPEHWDVLPNRALFFEVKDREHPDEEMLSVTITKGIVRQKTLLAESAKKDSSNLDRSAYKLVQPDDIAYNKMRAWQGAIGASPLRGIVSPAYVIMRSRDASSATYFHQLFRTPMFADEAGRWSYGITSDMWSLRPEHFKMIYSVVPPPEDKAAIVRVLDHFDRTINRYIRTKQALITVLEEMRQAIIYRTITRGLDIHAPRNSTTIEWLPSIPAHWSIRKLGQIGRVFNGTTPSRMQPAYWADGTIAWLSSGKVNDYIINTASELITDKAYKERSVSLVPRGSVVLGLVGQGKTRGMSALLNIDAW
jgi:type I restriction enzyme, S subunit